MTVRVEHIRTWSAGAPDVVRRRGVPYGLGAALAAATLAAAIPTLLDRDLLGRDLLAGPEAMNGSARGTALVMAAVAVPVLLLSMRWASRGSARAVPVWLGATAYLLYNSVLLLFATPFNAAFLLYVLVLSLSLWTLVALLVHVDVWAFAERVAPTVPARSVAAYVWVVAGLNALIWLRVIVPAVAQGDDSFLDGTGLPTNPVYVQDLAVWLPLAAVAAWWLWHRRPWGALVTGGVLVLWVAESLGIAVDQWTGSAADPASPVASAGVVPVFAVLALVGLLPVIALLRRIG
ncbi:MAG TPA: hypothetical protein VK894_14730 [Jiangellales bacterium]|nr:hypothetical protein [Jiangellales bacterium]